MRAVTNRENRRIGRLQLTVYGDETTRHLDANIGHPTMGPRPCGTGHKLGRDDTPIGEQNARTCDF